MCKAYYLIEGVKDNSAIYKDSNGIYSIPIELEKYLLSYLLSFKHFYLVECCFPSNFSNLENIKKIDEKLSLLIESGINYPPVIGLASEILKYKLDNNLIDMTDILSYYESILGNVLSHIHNEKYFMAKSLVSDGYKTKDCYYWILSYLKEEEKVLFLTYYDYCIYEEDLEDFEIKDFSMLEKISFNNLDEFYLKKRHKFMILP